MTVDSGIMITFILYFVFMIGIGAFFYSKANNLSDYILGGRKLNSWVAALSAQASDMSGWLLLGLPGAAYLSGLESSWIAVGLLVGTYLNWKFVARKLRLYTEKANNALTISDYLENRFDDRSKILRILSAAFILLFFLIYTASGFVAGARLFETVFGLNYLLALSIVCFNRYFLYIFRWFFSSMLDRFLSRNLNVLSHYYSTSKWYDFTWWI